jgi:hypothetical protein
MDSTVAQKYAIATTWASTFNFKRIINLNTTLTITDEYLAYL